MTDSETTGFTITLRQKGTIVSYRNVSGPVLPFVPIKLAAKPETAPSDVSFSFS